VIVAEEEGVGTALKRFWGKIAIGLWAATALVLALGLALLRPFVQGEMSVLDFGLASVLYAIAAITIWYALEGRHAVAAAGAILCSLVLSVAFFGVLAPQLSSLWISKRLVDALPRAEDGGLPPLGVGGYNEPSIVFLAGTATLLAPPQALASMLAETEGAVVAVEAAERPAFLAAARGIGLRVTNEGRVGGFNYSNGSRVVLTLYRASGVTP
jgi:hypothetical protein